MGTPGEGVGEETISVNRKAYHEYHILEKAEAGLVLTGTEVKSLRAGRVSLQQAYVRPEGGELWLVGSHVPRYPAGGPFNHEPTRSRKLLLHREEIDRLTGLVQAKGRTLVPLRLFFRGGWAKLEVGLAVGKKLYDKRRALQEREAQREMGRAVKIMRRR